MPGGLAADFSQPQVELFAKEAAEEELLECDTSESLNFVQAARLTSCCKAFGQRKSCQIVPIQIQVPSALLCASSAALSYQSNRMYTRYQRACARSDHVPAVTLHLAKGSIIKYDHQIRRAITHVCTPDQELSFCDTRFTRVRKAEEM